MQKDKKMSILTPFEIADVRLALATIDAGAFPILHLGRDMEIAEKALDRMVSFTDKHFGVCIASDVLININLPASVTTILAPLELSSSLQNRKADILYQVHSLDELDKAMQSDVKSIVLKGNEGAGKVAKESSFILFQKLMSNYSNPNKDIYIQGGVGIHSSAAFIAMGAKGVILDSQVALFPESNVPKDLRKMFGKLSGSETVVVDDFRVLHRNTSPTLPDNATQADVVAYLGGMNLSENYIPMGQDITLAVDFYERHRKLANFVYSFKIAVYGHLRQAKELKTMSPNSPMSVVLGTKYPIAQGPMARISDVPEFAKNIADAGALPFLALSLMNGEPAEELINNTAKLLEDKPWGIGILGFLPTQLREEQTKLIIEKKPPFVLIAGGRPSLAKPFEEEGIKTFLHVPSASLLDTFLKEGSKSFIFEGRESGGHIGPLFSLILWEKQIFCLANFNEENKTHYNVFFAGGIHDAFSSAFVSIMAAPLAAKGVKIGVLMGTSYLYTEEAVKSGAILEEYRAQLISQQETVVLEAAPGQETRSVASPFTSYFQEEKRRLVSENLDSKDIWIKLEELNIGRLRVASKGTERQGDELIGLTQKEQVEKGLYMAGEIAALRNKPITAEELHTDVTVNSTSLLTNLEAIEKPKNIGGKPLEVAIVGMECIFPESRNLEEYWKHILHGKDCVTTVPDTRWNKELFFNPESRDSDYIISDKGGFIPTIDFNPLEFGITPQSLSSIEPVQLLSLYVAKRALEDAGYNDLSDVDTEFTSVIFGAEGATELATAYSLRTGAKQLFGELPEDIKKVLPKLNSDSFAGVLSNVIAGRIANRLNLGGRNYTVDAACASSIAALDLGCQELTSGRSDMVVLGGADLHNGANDYLMFNSTYALSKKGYCATFDIDSDGISLGEGIAVLVLKRLEDAERDGNKIYAVVKGVGGSSDGKSLGMTAPSRKGQMRALEGAHIASGVLPSEIGLIEAHGTGTLVGDKAEFSALNDIFMDGGATLKQTYLGSVKTQIGHTKCAAGIAGIIKATLAVQHGVIPPTIHLNKPISLYDEDRSPFLFNTKAGLWNDERRVAGVSAFGFGGTNFHAVIENYKPKVTKRTIMSSWPAELFIFRGDDLGEAKKVAENVKDLLELNDTIRLVNISYTLAKYNDKPIQITLIAQDLDDLMYKLDSLLIDDDSNPDIYYRNEVDGKVAFLFSGQGSQRVNMARDLFVTFPSMRRLLVENREYEKIIFPETFFDSEKKEEVKTRITDTRNAQPLLGMVDWAIADFLRSLGIIPDMVAGHSYGELPALCFSGVFKPEELVRLSRERAQAILNAIEDDKGMMVAVSIPQEDLNDLLEDETEVWAVNYNSHKQTVLAGTTDGMKQFMEKMTTNKLACKEINVACAFHSPLLNKSENLYAEVLKEVKFDAPQIDVWSNTTSQLYPTTAQSIKERLCEHLVKPVFFSKQIENMHADGAKIFIEAGPGRVLTSLTQTILGDKAVTIQTEGNAAISGVQTLLSAVAKFISTGREIDIEKLFEDRKVSTVDIDNIEQYRKLSTTWKINGHNAVPLFGSLPADSALPIIKPIFSLLDMKNNSIPQITPDHIVMGYIDNMKTLIEDHGNIILGYLGQVEITPHTAVRERVSTMVNSSAEFIDEISGEMSETTELAIAESELPHILTLESDELKDIMLDVISEKTGYPLDMLGLDMDLESDLSIDSIKRMEIIIGLRDRIDFGDLDSEDASEDSIEKLASIKTINALIDWIEEVKKEAAKEVERKKIEVDATTVEFEEVAGDGNDALKLARIYFTSVETPINLENTISIEGKKFAITNDGSKFSIDLKNKLEEKGAIAEIINLGDSIESFDGLIFMNIIESKTHYTLKDWFHMVKSANMKQLKWLYTFTDSTAYALNSDDLKELKNIQGYSGLVKSIALEYPEINCRVVKSKTPFNLEIFSDIVYNELIAGKLISPEIVYEDATRFSFEPKESPLLEEKQLELDEDSVVLVLGGAQGISPELVSQMATSYPCNYVLVGRSFQLMDEKTNKDYYALTTKDEIRKHLIIIDGLKVPKEIEARVQEIFKSNQIGRAIHKITEAGGKVTYKAVDVRNASDFEALTNEIKSEHGKIDGVIHAAGILEDKLFIDKDWDSFERVYSTKVDPLHHIIDNLSSDLKFLILFSSATSVFGNIGQTDYAAANSVFDMTSLIMSMSKSDLKVMSFNWGPWKGAGMVSDLLEAEFAKRGVSLIPLKEGGELFMNEIKYGTEPSVLVVGGTEESYAKLMETVNAQQ